MKAAVIHQFGDFDLLKYEDVPMAHQILPNIARGNASTGGRELGNSEEQGR